MDLVVGLDAGGTSTRALVLGLDGARLGQGLAGGANPNSHPPDVAAAHIGEALAEALDGLDSRKVRSGVLGMAGASRMTDPAVLDLFQGAWERAGLHCPMRVITDCEAAFATGTSSADGTVLVAGTGSIAGRIAGHRMVGQSGGYGWLIGDDGSAFWLGREAVRATLKLLDLDAPLEGLATAVLTAAGARNRGQLITAVNAAAPIKLAQFAPLVSSAYHHGDPEALAIVASAARLLADTATAVREPSDTSPIVLVGSLIKTPVGTHLKQELLTRCNAPVIMATEGAAGAAWLAAVDVLGPDAPRPSRS
ncbi:BadF/BadG/BcrA/BcrD ATPase family protein [Lentzea sp. BCCO 10_0798]|uniref:BadF/BadG/BcrA/BcrD ATPase family protein n=1 Tax=Lentzea kristufekii TaxID=3095430 RepID=A0ABU4TTP8_9PSEU|nr:BadF/BadG/BcrA/BcrD ATPase family protein [Lentzea sp. BCCO 10_0798]MDX8051297.1 BadF/BadG/BcrA/BcrD ATPase family protein [Lentzea sp. BCCO 10_0798]